MAELTTIGQSKTFNYTGNVQSITLEPGRYKMECYGASGGGGNGGENTAYSGLGGYTSGILNLPTQITFYIYVGGVGKHATVCVGGWNGGGGADNVRSSSGSGGGATDIRITNGAWNNTASLRSRIMVAGGGGGGARFNAKGGDGGGLIGGSGNGGGGGTQTSGGTSGGGFGIGGDGPTTNYGKGCGGGGYYGGGANAIGNNYYHSGGGGSSFISGLTGCNAVNASGSHTGQPNHYSGLIFTECTTKTGSNLGNGYAIITYLGSVYTVNITKGKGVELVTSNIDLDNVKTGENVEVYVETFSPGYKWGYWSGDFEQQEEILSFVMPEKDVNITANALPRDDTIYSVRHYLVNLDNSNTLKETIEYQGTTETSVSPPVNEYIGFISPEIKSAIINGDGSTVIDYYYDRQSYIVTVLCGICDKESYLFEETVNLEYTKMDDASEMFSYWYSEDGIDIPNLYNKQASFIMPAFDCTIIVIGKPNRLNTNIYKNIFPEEIFNVDYINELLDNLPQSANDIQQRNHGLIEGDIVYLDSDGLYKRALAENSEKGKPVGIVSKVQSKNVFTLVKSGLVDYNFYYKYTDTTVLYLSDVTPGRLLHYEMIQNRIYIPVAIYTKHGFIINIQEGTIGSEMFPYGETVNGAFEYYTQEEIEETIESIKDGVVK